MTTWKWHLGWQSCKTEPLTYGFWCYPQVDSIRMETQAWGITRKGWVLRSSSGHSGNRQAHERSGFTFPWEIFGCVELAERQAYSHFLFSRVENNRYVSHISAWFISITTAHVALYFKGNPCLKFLVTQQNYTGKHPMPFVATLVLSMLVTKPTARPPACSFKSSWSSTLLHSSKTS